MNICRLLCEIHDVLGDRKEVTGDDLDKMKYTEQVGAKLYKYMYVYQNNFKVIQEVLRVYPQAPAVPKESPEGGITLRGFHVPKGTIIFVSWNFHIMNMC